MDLESSLEQMIYLVGHRLIWIKQNFYSELQFLTKANLITINKKYLKPLGHEVKQYYKIPVEHLKDATAIKIEQLCSNYYNKLFSLEKYHNCKDCYNRLLNELHPLSEYLKGTL